MGLILLARVKLEKELPGTRDLLTNDLKVIKNCY